MFRFTIRDLLWLMVVAVGSLAAQEPEQTLKQLLKQGADPSHTSPQQDAVRAHLRFHAEPQHNGKRRLLVISKFFGGGRHALRYEVEERGSSYNVRAVYSFAEVSPYDGLLSTENVRLLRELLPKLPESKVEPSIDQTVHVSFQSGDKWRTETYDVSDLPDELKKVHPIVIEPLTNKVE